jgi:ATP-dependent helicase/nuclease subunit A
MPEWTKQQQDAIETRGRSIIVSAAAGSGKTAVLVERLLRILSDHEHPVPADRIIVVTYTNDAAAEMKQRLSKALSARLAVLDDGPEYEWLLEQRVRLSSARISTVHSFCFDLIRENADALDVQPGFIIAESGQESICQSHALDTVMERWTSEKPEMQLLYDHFCAQSDRDIEVLILGIAEFLGAVAFPQQWFRDARRLAADPEALFERIRAGYCRTLADVITLYEQAEPFAQQALPDDPNNKYVIRLHEELIALREHLAYLRDEPMETICADPLRHEVKFATFRGPTKNVVGEFKDSFVRLRKVVLKNYQNRVLGYKKESGKDAVKKLGYLRFFAEDAALTKKLIPALLDLVEEYLEALRAEKRERNILTFSDAEELALRLLADWDKDGKLIKSALASQLSEQYDLIMVDEYQDTNDKQDHIFKLLSHGTRIDEDGIHYGDNAFLVGDVKQSIYSFRQADPENFRRAIAESTPLAEQGGGMARIYLNQNFRSAPGVLDFINALFGAVMRGNCGDVDYNEDEQLNFGSQIYREYPGKTQILVAADNGELPEDADLQAECVAGTIASMIGNTPVLIPGENGTVTTRPAQAGDFCILLRTKKVEVFVDTLRRRGIGVSANKDSGLLDLPEIHLIRSLLRVADNPMTDTALAAVMLSAVGGFTVEELAELRLYAKENRLYKQMCYLNRQEGEEHPTLRRKVKDCLALITSLQDTAVRLPLEDAIWEIYAQTDLLALQSVYEDAAQRRSHLDAFARLAGDYSRFADLTAQSCLSGWLRYLDRLEKADKHLEVKGGAGVQGCVQIKTIHKSKGLEFPFVFAAKLDNKFSDEPSKKVFQASSDGLLGLKIFDRARCVTSKTAAYWYLLDEVCRGQTSEELRLLYVALTRAKQQLFIVMDNKSIETAAGKFGTILEQAPGLTTFLAPWAGCMQDWILYFLLAGKDRMHMERLMEGEESSGTYADYRIWHYQPYEQPQLPAPKAQPDAAQADLIRRQLSFTYMTTQSALVSKNTVTQLAHPETGVLELMHKPQFTLENKSKTALRGTARGTAVHKIMQMIDFTLAAQDPQAALDALLAAGAVSQSEYESIDAAHLGAFFKSGLYQRIAAAEQVERERKIFVELGTLELPEYPEIIAPYRGTDSTLIGTMDLVFREPDGWVILDYKTDHAKAEEKLMREYALQLHLYRAAAEQIFGERVKELYLYSFSLDSAIEITELPHGTEGDHA